MCVRVVVVVFLFPFIDHRVVLICCCTNLIPTVMLMMLMMFILDPDFLPNWLPYLWIMVDEKDKKRSVNVVVVAVVVHFLLLSLN